jgi:phospholipase C
MTPDAVGGGDVGGDVGGDAPADLGPDLNTTPCDPSSTGPCSNIKHVVLMVQENHTFDNMFGRWCTAATGSNPTCDSGPSCCEAGPAKDPGGSTVPATLNDMTNARRDPNHTAVCELDEINGGAMDKFVTSTVAMNNCGNAGNLLYADPAGEWKPYIDLASQNAMADRYFQSMAGASSGNDMYFARAKFVFDDNTVEPDSIGKTCSATTNVMSYTDMTIGDLLTARGVDWSVYADGYQVMKDAVNASPTGCPMPPADCPLGIKLYPCVFDPSDIPFQYYPSTADNPATMRDFSQFQMDLDAGKLPAFSYLKAIGYKSEHPGYGNKLSPAVDFVTNQVIAKVMASSAANDTLILIVYDEGGGFFDHIAPPPTSAIDGKPYGTRTPFIAIGRFAKKNYISHVVMEHSSVVKFLEWNFLGGQTGQLGTRDTEVNNIGSLLDPAETGRAVPEN